MPANGVVIEEVGLEQGRSPITQQSVARPIPSIQSPVRPSSIQTLDGSPQKKCLNQPRFGTRLQTLLTGFKPGEAPWGRAIALKTSFSPIHLSID
ncbi:hypothetical protein [Leptolyngbya sp. O-77]|uniref:hypothetical protein n=1 Tax=Leptolyngbya sp. O-77 TaxID=1080068 RepID=UPI00155F8454|nr:hypothetical protein [Leptolyngbya sp. O-77]